MADLVLGVGTSHSPLLSVPSEMWGEYGERDKRNPWLYRISDGAHVGYEEILAEVDPSVRKELNQDTYDARHAANQKGIARVADAIKAANLDVLVMFGDDQNEIFSLNAMPALCVFWGDEVEFKQRAAKEGDKSIQALVDWYGGLGPWSYPVDAAMGKHVVESLNEEGFDIMHVREMPEGKGMSHAFGFVWRRLMTQIGKTIPTIPFHINTYFPPNQPTPARCLDLGAAVRRAIDSWTPGVRVGVLASGGFSHFVVDEDIDRQALKALEDSNFRAISELPVLRLQAGTSEIRNWFAVAGVMGKEQHFKTYDYVPCYRSEAGTGCAMAFGEWG